MKIIVAGAGIAGLAAARALERKGHHCHIYEQFGKPRDGGMGIFLLGNATRALSQLGLLEAIEPQAYAVSRQTIFSSRGKLLNEVSSQAYWTSSGPCLAMPRTLLVETLRNSLVATNITYGKAAVDIEETLHSSRLHFSDGSTEECDLVIAADGIGSRLRTSVSGVSPRSLGITCWRTVVENCEGIDGWTAMLGPKRTLLAIPISPSKAYLYADCQTDKVSGTSLRDLRKTFADFDGAPAKLLANLKEPTVIHCSGLEEVPEVHHRKDNVLLIGDAAHACSPSMAQGAGMALEDALVVADLASSCSSARDIIRKFSTARHDRIAWVRKQSRARDKMRNFPELLRDLTIGLAGDYLYHRAYGPLRAPLDRPLA